MPTHAQNNRITRKNHWITIVINDENDSIILTKFLLQIEDDISYCILSGVEKGTQRGHLQYDKLHCHLFISFHRPTSFKTIYNQLRLQRYAKLGYWCRKEPITSYDACNFVQYCLKPDTKIGSPDPSCEIGTRLLQEKKSRSNRNMTSEDKAERDTRRVKAAQECKCIKECITKYPCDTGFWLSPMGMRLMALYPKPITIDVPDREIMDQQVWMIGAPGVGKTHTIIEYYTKILGKRMYKAPVGRFWDSYHPDNYDIILLEDVDTDFLSAFGDGSGISTLKDMTCGSGFWYEEKHLPRQYSPPKMFVVTSNIAINCLMDTRRTINIGVHVTSLQRRFKVQTLRQFMDDKGIIWNNDTKHIELIGS